MNVHLEDFAYPFLWVVFLVREDETVHKKFIRPDKPVTGRGGQPLWCVDTNLKMVQTRLEEDETLFERLEKLQIPLWVIIIFSGNPPQVKQERWIKKFITKNRHKLPVEKAGRK